MFAFIKRLLAKWFGRPTVVGNTPVVKKEKPLPADRPEAITWWEERDGTFRIAGVRHIFRRLQDGRPVMMAEDFDCIWVDGVWYHFWAGKVVGPPLAKLLSKEKETYDNLERIRKYRLIWEKE
jgi:hypothetical protein